MKTQHYFYLSALIRILLIWSSSSSICPYKSFRKGQSTVKGMFEAVCFADLSKTLITWRSWCEAPHFADPATRDPAWAKSRPEWSFSKRICKENASNQLQPSMNRFLKALRRKTVQNGPNQLQFQMQHFLKDDAWSMGLVSADNEVNQAIS